MKHFFKYGFLILISSQAFGQEIKEKQILGAWMMESFELSPKKKDYTGIQEEPIYYLWFTEKTLTLRGSCNIYRDRFSKMESTRYAIKISDGSDTITLKLKSSNLLKTCGDTKYITIVSYNDSILKIKSFTNEGFVNFRKMPTPDEVAKDAHRLIQGSWNYERSFGFNSGISYEKSNLRDSIVSFSFSKDSVQIKFMNNIFETIHTEYSIEVEPYFNWINVIIKDVEELYCIQIPRLGFSIDQISETRFITHLCGTDTDEVHYIKVD